MLVLSKKCELGRIYGITSNLFFIYFFDKKLIRHEFPVTAFNFDALLYKQVTHDPWVSTRGTLITHFSVLDRSWSITRIIVAFILVSAGPWQPMAIDYSYIICAKWNANEAKSSRQKLWSYATSQLLLGEEYCFLSLRAALTLRRATIRYWLLNLRWVHQNTTSVS